MTRSSGRCAWWPHACHPNRPPARQRIRRQARKKGRTPRRATLLAAGYCLVLTTLPATPAWSREVLLALYRVRWQIEWWFRRWQSLCHLKQLPAHPSRLAEPVLWAKLLLLLWLHRHLAHLRWLDWYRAPAPAPVMSTVVRLLFEHLRQLIRPTYVVLRLLQEPERFLRHLRASRRQRPNQLQHTLQLLIDHFTTVDETLAVAA